MRKELFKLIERNSAEIEESEKNGIIAHHVEVDDLIDDLEKLFAIPVVRQQSELFVSFARFVANYKHSYATAYEDMFKEWCDKRNI